MVCDSIGSHLRKADVRRDPIKVLALRCPANVGVVRRATIAAVDDHRAPGPVAHLFQHVQKLLRHPGACAAAMIAGELLGSEVRRQIAFRQVFRFRRNVEDTINPDFHQSSSTAITKAPADRGTPFTSARVEESADVGSSKAHPKGKVQTAAVGHSSVTDGVHGASELRDFLISQPPGFPAGQIISEHRTGRPRACNKPHARSPRRLRARAQTGRKL